ncbi:MAG: tetratricopeptide repeat protein [Kamptonema sp. SIO4C4]|nr:tetratricopeptide repeat protein [Kamptonema sp. SIO4C4]
MAVVQMREGNYDQAIATYEQIIAQNLGDSGEIYGMIGSVLIERGENEKAVELLQRAAQEHPNNVKIRLPLAVALLNQGNYDRGVTILEDVARLDPRNPEVHLQIGRIRQAQEDWEAAEEAFSQAAHLAPDSAEVHVAVGNFWMSRNMFLMATVSYRRATELDPHNPKIFQKLGEALQNRRRPEEAKDILETARRLYREQGDSEGVTQVNQLIEDID